jgi:hypothetical protein
MTLCTVLSVIALALLFYVLLFKQEYMISKEGFVEYIVYGPPGPWWRWGPRRPWMHRRWYRPYAWPGRFAYFY